jgi:macrocin-O-methyltransferase TylF-like protien
MTATDTLQLAPGVFVTWGKEDPRVGHVDRPFDLFELSADMVALLARFTRPLRADMALQELAVGPDSRDAALAALTALRDAGLLVDPDKASAVHPLRDAAFEAPRATNSCPDIALADPEFTQLYRTLAAVTLTSPQLAYALRCAAQYLSRSGVVGDIVECGVWRGGSMALTATTLLQAADHQRQLWLYDTFGWQWEPEGPHDGFLAAERAPGSAPAPAEGPPPTSAKSSGTSKAEVLDLLTRTGYPAGQFHLVQGLVQDTIPAQAPDCIALLRLDTDYYDSTRHELEHLYPRLTRGGVLIVDDYGKLSGATKAVDEYFAAVAHPPLLQRVDVQGRMAVKP